MEEKVFDLLRSVGLSRNETIVYLDLVGKRESTAREISTRTRLHRANTYEALKGLIGKGFVLEVLKGEKKLFQAEHPRILKDYIKQKEQEIEDVLPTLLSFAQEVSDESENVSMTKGLFASRNALNSLLEYKHPIDVYGIPSNILETMGEGFLNDFHRQRLRKRIPIRMVFNHDFNEYIARLNKSSYTEARHAGQFYASYAMVFICYDTVLLLVAADKFSTIEIKNKEIANSYKSYFNTLWENAKQQTSVV